MSETLATSADSFAALRETMVERQIRTFDVSDLAVQARMKTVPREIFVDDAYASLAYSDARVLATGAAPRELTAPLILGRLLKEAHVRETDRVLVVGGASGYAAALIAGLAAEVVSLDEDAALTAKAQANFARLGLDNAKAIAGPLTAGGAKSFDLIVVDGVVTGSLDALGAQLAEGGRMVSAVSSRRGRAARAKPIWPRSPKPWWVSARTSMTASTARTPISACWRTRTLSW